MVNDFQMTISTEDMLRVLNAGINALAHPSITSFIEKGDRVAGIQYSRDSKRYTLVFESGRKIKVVEKQAAA